MRISRPGLGIVSPIIFAVLSIMLTVVSATAGAPLAEIAALALISFALLGLIAGLVVSLRVRAVVTRWSPVLRRAFVGLVLVVLAVSATANGAPVLLTVVLWVLAVFEGCVLVLVLILALRDTLPATREHSMTQWWYNNKTGEVEEGPQSLGSDRDGPFETREDAARAPEIIAERARRWAAEDD